MSSGAEDGNGDQGIRSRIIEARVSDVVLANQIADAARNLRRFNMNGPVRWSMNARQAAGFPERKH